MAKIVHQVNDAADAVDQAKTMVWAVFYMAQGMRQDELSEALTACCNHALFRLTASAGILEALADDERNREGM